MSTLCMDQDVSRILASYPQRVDFMHDNAETAKNFVTFLFGQVRVGSRWG